MTQPRPKSYRIRSSIAQWLSTWLWGWLPGFKFCLLHWLISVQNIWRYLSIKQQKRGFKCKLRHVATLLKTVQWFPIPYNEIPNPYNGPWDLEWGELWLYIQGIMPLPPLLRVCSSPLVYQFLHCSLLIAFTRAFHLLERLCSHSSHGSSHLLSWSLATLNVPFLMITFLTP